MQNNATTTKTIKKELLENYMWRLCRDVAFGVQI
jgi:hypothetical protein